jgi:hypothetical protein
VSPSCSLERRRQRTRAAATELAGHRRRLLASGAEADLDPADAMLLRIAPADHRIGLARIAEAALAVGAVDSHTEPKSAAGQSRPPVSELRLSSAQSALAPRSGADATASTPSSTPPGRGADVTQTQEENH